MRITISFKLLLLFLFILFENVILHEINKSKKYYDENDSVATITTTPSIFINDELINNRTSKSNKFIKIINNNSEAVNIIYNNKKNNNLSEINLHNFNIKNNLTNNYEIPKPLNIKQNSDKNDNNDKDGKDEKFESKESKNLDSLLYGTDTFSFRHFKPLRNSNKKSKTTKRPTFLNVALQNAARHGLEAMTILYERTEPEILRRRQILIENHPAIKLAKFNGPHDENFWQAERAAYATLEATKTFQKSYKRTTTELGRQATSTKFSFRRTALEGLCPPRELPICLLAAKRYRTHDGTCNNFKHPRWGSAQMPFNRFLPPEYGDGIDTVRASIEGGGALSSARFVSLLVHGAREGNAPVTLILAQWGQLIDHDLTSTAQPRSINGSIPRCCGPNDFHPSCFPIKVPIDDPWLAPLKVRCLEFLRSAPAQRRDCLMSWREQTNQVTSFLDASPIYSSNARNSDNARVFRNGLLQFGRDNNPIDDNCNKGGFSPNCIKSGDPRSNEQPGLMALHHLWVGEHNRIAGDLSLINPQWSDEKVYQETRRIIGALFQHITYREFLPLVLGREVCRLFDLDLLNSGYYTGYDSHVNPTVANSFSAAAFRFGHSLIPNSYIRCDQGHNMIQNNVSLHEEFAHGDMGTRGSLHRLLRGMVNQRALQRDEFITPELTNHLFQTGNFPFGLDLAAINIQRGRDHGISPYTTWREPCGLTPINDWDDLNQVVGPESVRRMRHAYISVHDIDLFVGGIAERAVIGGLVGPTFACIIAQQFSNLRRGDRFWYENGGFENSFTPAQLTSIRRVSLAQILCRTTSGGTYQPHIFIPHEADNNQRLPCGIGVLRPIDLRPWKEQDPFKNTGNDLPFTITHMTNDIPLPIPIHNEETESEDVLTLADTTGQMVETSSAKETNEKDTKVNNVLLNKIDFVPNGSTGFHKPLSEKPIQNQINDKLDFTNNKTTTKRTPIINVQIIDNKLDSKKKLKTSTTTTEPTKQITTKRKAFVNNVKIELGRTANTAQKTKNPKRIQDQYRDMDISKDKQNITKTEQIFIDKLNVDNTGTENNKELLTESGKQEQDEHEKHLEQTKDNYKNFDSTDSMYGKQDDILILHNEKERMQTEESNNRAFLVTNDNKKQLLCKNFKENTMKTALKNIKSDNIETLQTKCIYDNHNILKLTTEPKTDLLIFNMDPTTDKPTKSFGLRNVHFNKDGTENTLRKQNINIITATDGPNQEYEIEINIRKTNKNRNPSTTFIQNNRKTSTVPIANDYNNLHLQSTPTDDSPFSHRPIAHIRPISQYNNNVNTKIPSIQMTKPPKIYYVSDEDDPFNRPENTTPRPGFFDNFFPSITGTFNGIFNSIQNLDSNSMTITDRNEIIVTPPNRRVDLQHSTGTLINGVAQDNTNQGQPIFFQPVLPNNAVFDPNKNKKPDYININNIPLSVAQNNNKPGYGFASNPIEITQNDWNNYIQSTTPFSHFTTRNSYYERPSTNYRPTIQTNYQQSQIYIQNYDQQRKPYYRNQNSDTKVQHKNLELQLDLIKYKITTKATNIGLMTTTQLEKNNVPDKQMLNSDTTSIDNNTDNNNSSNEKNEDDYEYYDSDQTEDNSTEQKINEQFDIDGYLRPEHTFLNLATEISTFKNETVTQSTLNDNYVMTALFTKTDLTKIDDKLTRDRLKIPLKIIDTIPRSPLTDIKAETDKRIEQFKINFELLEFDNKSDSIELQPKISSSTNWLSYDENITENPPLPILPELRINEESTNEFPKPINTSKWQKRFTFQVY